MILAYTLPSPLDRLDQNKKCWTKFSGLLPVKSHISKNATWYTIRIVPSTNGIRLDHYSVQVMLISEVKWNKHVVSFMSCWNIEVLKWHTAHNTECGIHGLTEVELIK